MPTDRKTICFGVPDLANAADDDLERAILRRDGAWSSTTKAALKRFNAVGLDLDSNWASTPINWTCPACGRAKPQLFRLTTHGVLLARLDSHHDHLDDRLKDMLKAKLGQRWIEHVGPGASRVQSLATRTLVRFEPTLICIDCNGVDGQIKRHLSDISKWFSFSPTEIRQVVIPCDNREHEIDFDKAAQVHKLANDNFRLRETLMQQIVDLIVAGELNQERSNIPQHFGGSEFSGFLTRELIKGGVHGALSQDWAAFERRSLSRQGASAPRPSTVVLRPPTVEEVESHYGGGSLGLWRAVPPDWQCEGCGRGRGEILRRSKNKNHPWSGRLSRHTEYILRQLYDEETGYPETFIDHEHTHIICMDCAQISSEIRKQRSDLNSYELVLQLGDIRSVIVAKPNTNHTVDWQEAFRRFEASKELVASVEAYRHEASVVANTLWEYRLRLDRHNNDRERARNALIRDYARLLGIPEDVAYRRLKVQIARAQYLETADPGLHYRTVKNPETPSRTNTLETTFCEVQG